jgi:SAM-dependent methyltransferase
MDPRMYEVNWSLEDHHWWFRGRRRIFVDVLRRQLGPTVPGAVPRLLAELGCGTGGNLPALAQLGRVIGVEPDAQSAEWARRKTGVEVVVDKLPECPSLPEATFDAIGMFDVLEHISDDQSALRRVRVLLRPGGFVLLSVPAFHWLWTRHDESLHHLRRYTRRTLTAAIQESGLLLRYALYFNFWLFPPVAALRLYHRAMGRGPLHDFSLPRAPINAALEWVFASESHRLARGKGFPVGVSLLALAWKEN